MEPFIKTYSRSNSLFQVFAIDEKQQQIGLFSGKQPLRTYRFDQIISANIVSDAVNAGINQNSSAIRRAVVGELLFGPIGMILGGATASKKTQVEISRLEIHIVVDDIRSPLLPLKFIAGLGKMKADSWTAKSKIQEAELACT